MTMSGLTCDVLRTILVFLSMSSDGAADVARAVLTCKRFMNLAKDSDVLKAINWRNVKLDGRFQFFSHIDGLLSNSADAGNQTAIYMLSKVVLYGSTSLWSRMLDNDNLLASINQMNNYTAAQKEEIVSMIKDETKREMPCISNVFDGNLHHKRLVRSFLVQCSFEDIILMRYHLETYAKYFAGPEAAFKSGIFDCIKRICAHVHQVYNELLDFGIFRYITEDVMGESASFDEISSPTRMIPPSQVEVFESLRTQLISNFDQLFSPPPAPGHLG